MQREHASRCEFSAGKTEMTKKQKRLHHCVISIEFTDTDVGNYHIVMALSNLGDLRNMHSELW